MPVELSCDAYPESIPDEIVNNEVDHREPVKGRQRSAIRADRRVDRRRHGPDGVQTPHVALRAAVVPPPHHRMGECPRGTGGQRSALSTVTAANSEGDHCGLAF